MIRFIPFLLLLVSCSQQPVKVTQQADSAPCDCPAYAPVQWPDTALPAPVTETSEPVIKPAPEYTQLQKSGWEAIDALDDDKLSAAWGAWQQSCSTLVNKR